MTLPIARHGAILPTAALRSDHFTTEAQIQFPSQTAVLADGRYWAVTPHATDIPPTNLVRNMDFGNFVPTHWGTANPMSIIAVPRHGNRPARVPTLWPKNAPLPGAVNVSFFDGHVETVKLDKLWQLYWHADYKPPAKRPGL